MIFVLRRFIRFCRVLSYRNLICWFVVVPIKRYSNVTLQYSLPSWLGWPVSASVYSSATLVQDNRLPRTIRNCVHGRSLFGYIRQRIVTEVQSTVTQSWKLNSCVVYVGFHTWFITPIMRGFRQDMQVKKVPHTLWPGVVCRVSTRSKLSTRGKLLENVQYRGITCIVAQCRVPCLNKVKTCNERKLESVYHCRVPCATIKRGNQLLLSTCIVGTSCLNRLRINVALHNHHQ